MHPIHERGPINGSGCANTELSAIIVSELRETYGIKYRKEKKQKSMHDKVNQRKIFNVPLDKLEMTDVILANGGITQVPLFVSDACQRILEQVSTEGLFRKAGSTARQREIRTHLEAGARLGKSHHVIDVANVLKLFFRELPEPILGPGNLQESILRCLLCGDRKVNALLLSVLLIPTQSLNTLTFFMQFLLTVSQHSSLNRMTPENLAIIFTPGLMPLPELIPQRLSSHCKVVQMLIEHANHIGTVPRYILERSRLTTDKAAAAQASLMSTPGGTQHTHRPDTDKKKKKRRSGMFNGLRKIVGSAIGSNDELDRSSVEMNPSTPCVKQAGKKRKVLEATGLSAKKKKDVLALLPEDRAMLPATPMSIKNLTKKTRLSLGGKRFEKKQPAPQILPDVLEPLEHHPVLERRWSVVGAGWPRKKSSTTTSDNAFSSRNSRKSMSAASHPMFSPSLSSPSLSSSTLISASSSTDTLMASTNSTMTPKLMADMQLDESDSDFMRISKSEYEAIKERVSAIETRISKEFSSVENETKHAMDTSFLVDDSVTAEGSNALDQVVDKYERTMSMQTEVMGSPSTDQLAKRLSRELKIRRRSAEHQVIRSPSARKIGTMRRRSRENVRLSRNFSWHVAPKTVPEPMIDSTDSVVPVPMAVLQPVVKANLKRGRPNTVQTGLRHPSPPKKTQSDSIDDLHNEQWTSGEKFFSNIRTPVQGNQENDLPTMPSTPFFVTTASMNEMKTPMLPPRRPLNFRTPLTASNHHNRTPMVPPRSTPQKSAPPVNKALLLTPMEDTQTGRASIARLRSQNAGMVAAKAKLFDAFSTDTEVPPPSVQPIALPRESTAFALEHFAAQNLTKQQKETAPNRAKPAAGAAPRPSLNVRMNNSPRKSMTPRRGTKNLNGIHRRQKLRLAKSPIKKASPMRLRHLLLEDTISNSSLVKNVTKTASPGGGKRRSTNHRQKLAVNKNCFHAAMDSIVNGSPSEQGPRTPTAKHTPHIRPALGTQSPRRLVKTPAPLRATPIKLRNSPGTLKLYRLADETGSG